MKGTLVVCGLNLSKAVSIGDLIDETQTCEFPEFCRHLQAAKRGDRSIRQQIEENSREARANVDRMLLGTSMLSSGIELVAKTYTPVELKKLRRREHYTPQMLDRLIRNVLLLTAELLKQHPHVNRVPRGPKIRNTFVFRYALCGYVSILKRIEEGGLGNVRPEKLRNDVIDMNFAAFATYFDGLLTSDKRAREMYADADFLLREIFAMPTVRARIYAALSQGRVAVQSIFRRSHRT